MTTRRRYVADPAVLSQPTTDTFQHGYPQEQHGYSQPIQQQQQQFAPPAEGQNAYAAPVKKSRVWDEDLEPPPSFAPPQGQQAAAAPYPLPPQNHIPQPPHAAGPSLRGPVPRIDPAQIPSPIEAAELDQNLYDQEDFESCNTKGLIPLASTDYRGIDQGNSLPRYIRPSLPQIPATSSLLTSTHLPLGLVINPFAAPRYDEAPIPYVNSFLQSSTDGGDVGGPPRCTKCRGYINPWCKFVDGGVKWVCNLCNGSNSVDSSYMSHLDSYGTRMDIQSRPELTHGTVDYPVPKSYWALNPSSLLDSNGLSDLSSDLLDSLNEAVVNAAEASGANEVIGNATGGTISRATLSAGGKGKKQVEDSDESKLRRPVPIGRVFAIDVSWSSARGGILREVCQGIREAIYGKLKEDKIEGVEAEREEEEWRVPEGRIGIVTFDRDVQFFNLSSGQESPQMMVVSDLEDMFVPLHKGFLVDPVQSRNQIEKVLELIPKMYADTPCTEVALGAVVKGVLSGLAGCGGQLSVFLSSLPNHGPGALKPREDPLIYGTDKEKSLFSPVDGFWRNTAEQLAEAGVGCNLWLFPERFIDVGSLGVLSSVTAGNIFFHPRFDPVRDREAVHEELRRIVGQEVVYNATLRVRCSNGLRVQNYTGNFHQRSLTDLEFGSLDAFQAFGAILRHDNKLDVNQPAYVQVAVLYTSAGGERRVRVLNLNMAVTNHIGNVFRFADFDTSIVLLLKEAVTQAISRNLVDIRRALTERCTSILLFYTKHVAPGPPSGQLILPEGFKLLPLFTLCMIKCKALKGGHVASDVRSLYLRSMRSMSLPATITFLYPRMFGVHDLPEKIGYADSTGRLQLPTYIRGSHAWMVAEGAYLLTNGETAFLWIGHAVSPQILNDLYGVENPDELDTRITTLPRLPTYLSTQVRNIIAHHSRMLGHDLPVIIARQNVDGTEVEFANMLVEDANNDALSYANYIMSVHKTLTDELNGGGKTAGWFS